MHIVVVNINLYNSLYKALEYSSEGIYTPSYLLCYLKKEIPVKN